LGNLSTPKSIVTDTAQLVPVGAIDPKYITGCLADLADEVVVGILRAADEAPSAIVEG
jgi:hypothetical protein